MTRQIIFDTETTGLNPQEGHRVIEIGCVELVNRKLTGNNFHYYLNPNRNVDEESIKIHGLTNQFLSKKPSFCHIVEEFLNYIKGAELIAHNAKFDLGFLDNELNLVRENLGKCVKIADYAEVTDTLVLAKKLHPGQRNSLDALCKRYGIDNTHRELHGALLDSHLLAKVYLAMTGGQGSLEFFATSNKNGNIAFEKNELDARQQDSENKVIKKGLNLLKSHLGNDLLIIRADESELLSHQEFLQKLAEKSNSGCLWQQLNEKLD